jgi:hypothetical protein
VRVPNHPRSTIRGEETLYIRSFFKLFHVLIWAGVWFLGVPREAFLVRISFVFVVVGSWQGAGGGARLLLFGGF